MPLNVMVIYMSYNIVEGDFERTNFSRFAISKKNIQLIQISVPFILTLLVYCYFGGYINSSIYEQFHCS